MPQAHRTACRSCDRWTHRQPESGSDAQNADAERPLQKREILTVRGDDGGAVPSCREGDQRIVLKLAPFAYLPSLFVADGAHESSGLPPVGGGWRPAHAREAE